MDVTTVKSGTDQAQWHVENAVRLGADDRGHVTLFCLEYGRGFDFKPTAKSIENNGGVCVVQAFFSTDPSEERQVEGRAARAGDHGEHYQVLLEQPLIHDLKVTAEQLRAKGEGTGLYAFLDETRQQLHHKAASHLCRKAKEAQEPHRRTIELKATLGKLAMARRSVNDTVHVIHCQGVPLYRCRQEVQHSEANYEPLTSPSRSISAGSGSTTLMLKLMKDKDAWLRELAAASKICNSLGMRVSTATGKSELPFLLPLSAACCNANVAAEATALLGGASGIQVHFAANVISGKGSSDDVNSSSSKDDFLTITNHFQQAICMAMGGRSLDTVIRMERFSEKPFRCIQGVVLDLLEGIGVLHDAGLRHGDVKPLNVVRHGDRFKLIDFDMCTALNDPPLAHVAKSKLLGSSAYLPPEVYYDVKRGGGFGDSTDASNHGHDRGWDLWGLGCTLYERVTCATPLFAKAEQGNGSDQLEKKGELLLNKFLRLKPGHAQSGCTAHARPPEANQQAAPTY